MNGSPPGTIDDVAMPPAANTERRPRRLAVVLGDQLNRDSAVFDGIDPTRDVVWMAEAAAESTYVWSHKARIALFLGAMRHFHERLLNEGLRVVYHRLGSHPHRAIPDALACDLETLNPETVAMAYPGEWRLADGLDEVIVAAGIERIDCPDRHFIMQIPEFAAWARGRRELRAEHLYRHLRLKTGRLMDDLGKPLGGLWNFDRENRRAFGRAGPQSVPEPLGFPPDAMTQAAFADIEQTFPDHPGRLADFDWPMTAESARAALADFIHNRLPYFGRYQDAMWTGRPVLFHSRISAALNLRLLNPNEVLDAAEAAYRDGAVPLAAAEGFIRQVLGWREFVRGVYWTRMPDYLSANVLNARVRLPDWYWTGATDMACLRDVIGQTLRFGYAHHIQRLMVTGLFALLLGVEPRQVHQWYLAVYVDAIEWVEAPNTIGMSQYADGGVVASKPYVASGRYIDRMSNYCKACRFNPAASLGPDACPFTTLYWDFLARHRQRFSRHPRAAQQWRQLERIDPSTLRQITAAAERIRATHAG